MTDHRLQLRDDPMGNLHLLYFSAFATVRCWIWDHTCSSERRRRKLWSARARVYMCRTICAAKVPWSTSPLMAKPAGPENQMLACRHTSCVHVHSKHMLVTSVQLQLLKQIDATLDRAGCVMHVDEQVSSLTAHMNSIRPGMLDAASRTALAFGMVTCSNNHDWKQARVP